jgi:hypothetical protein
VPIEEEEEEYHPTSSAYTSSSTFCCFKDKWAKSENLPKINFVSEIAEYCVEIGVDLFLKSNENDLLNVLVYFLLTGTSNSHPPECVIPDDVLIQFGPPDDEHLLPETCRGIK